MNVEQQLPIVVIGSGLAGYNLVKEIRRIDQQIPIVIYTSDDGALYSKPQLSTGFARGKSANDLILDSAENLADKYRVEINIFSPVKTIDINNKLIYLSNGGSRSYNKLILATGASCIQAPVTGAGVSKMHTVNDLLDYAKFRTLIQNKRRVLIIGAGLIGCEYANDLIQSGLEVEVVDPLSGALETLLPEPASKAVSNGLAAAGVKFHFGTVVNTIEHQGAGVIATLSNGKTITADIVLSAIGVRPNVNLALQAGIDCNKGIQVGRSLLTSAEDVFAIGDCAEVQGNVLVYIAPLNAQVRALAKTLTGEPTDVRYGVMPVMIKTKLHPVNVNPPINAEGEWLIDVEQPQGVKARFVSKNGDLLGYALTGDQCREGPQLMAQCPAVML